MTYMIVITILQFNLKNNNMKKLNDERLAKVMGGDFGIECLHEEFTIFGYGICSNRCYDLDGNFLYWEEWFCGPL